MNISDEHLARLAATLAATAAHAQMLHDESTAVPPASPTPPLLARLHDQVRQLPAGGPVTFEQARRLAANILRACLLTVEDRL